MLRKSFHGRLVLIFILIQWGNNSPSNAQEPEPSFNVGVASVDITPVYPVRLNGFGGRRTEAEGVSQQLWAKALAISDGDHPPFVVLAIDNLGVRETMVDQVAAALLDKYQIPREQVALTFTHTHCAPKVNGACDTIFSTPMPAEHQLHIDRYTEELSKMLIQVASQAIENRQPATLEWQIGKVTFAANRRTADGPVDHDLPVLLARDVNGKPFAVYTSYACHCVTLSFNWYSGDWAGYAQEAIEESFPGTTALVSIGCGSDSNPVSGVTGDRIEAAKDFGNQISDEVKRLFESPGRPIHGPITARRNSIPIALNELPTREALEALAKEGGSPGYNASWQLAKLDRGESLAAVLNYPVQSFTFGDDLHMVFLAGEVCVDYSLRLKRELNRDYLWVNGYSNDFGAYIPSERLLAEGGYGGGGEIPYFALPATLKAGLEQQIIDEVKQQTPEVFHLPDGTQGVPPKSPEESLRMMEIHNELQIELVAAEPLIADPVAIEFGMDGRLWVAEMPDYSRGVDDSFEQHGRIRFLVDTDNDGRFDTSTVFLTGLRFPTDVKVWRDGILVCDAPDVIFAADRDGDGIAEVREVLLSGFATHNPHARVNSLRFGWDGWVYGSGGLFGGPISSSSCKGVDTNNRDFRFNPDSGVIESASGQTQQGRTRDDFGNWFGCTNSALLLHYPLDERYTSRAPQISPPATIVAVPSEAHGQQLFPPANLVLFKLTGAPGRPTSACGAEIYRDQKLGTEYYGDAFVCEPVNQLVHRMKLSRDDQGRIVGNRAANELQSEFLRSQDQWFRPVQVRTGTDGAIYVVDMYRYVIEHSQWIPEETRVGLNLLAGQDRGRIYRISRRDQPESPIPRLNDKSDRELAESMRSTNGPLRDLVQQELLWRNSWDSDVNEVLLQIARDAEWPATKIQAIATLVARNQLPEEILIHELGSSEREARRALVQIGEALLSHSQPLRDAVRKLATNTTPEVDIQIAFSAAEMPPAERIELFTSLVDRVHGPWLDYAVLTSLKPQDVGTLWAKLNQSESPQAMDFYRSLTRNAADDQSASLDLVAQILGSNSGFALPQRWQLLSEWLRATASIEQVEVEQLQRQVFGQADLAIAASAQNARKSVFETTSSNLTNNKSRKCPMRFCMSLIIFATTSLVCLSCPEAVQPLDHVFVCQDAGAGGYEAFPDVCRLNDGRLMCVFYAGYGHVALPNDQLPNGGRIACCFSSDEGRTWSDAETLYDGPDDDRDPSIVQLKDGLLICNFFSLRKVDTPKGYEGLGSWIITSDDMGKTWSEPRQISKTHYCSAPIRELSNGRLILGLYTENGNQSQGSVIFSDDGGTTWQPEVLIDNGGIRLDAETDIVERLDGTLYAVQRPHMSFSTSKDFGSSWTVSEPIGFPGHCPYFLRTSDDVIVLAFRLPNTSLRFSRDECKTWSDNVLIDEVTGAYPSMVNLADGSVLVVYYEEGKGSSIRAKKFRVTATGVESIPFETE